MTERGTYKVTTAPASEPVTLAEARKHLNFHEDDPTDDDALITAMIQTARDVAEIHTRRALLTQTITQKLEGFPCWKYKNRYTGIRLFRPPLNTLKTVKYYDTENVLQTLYDSQNDPPGTASIIVNTLLEPAEIYPAYDTEWPETACRPDAVEIIYTAGWSAAGQVPPAIKQAMLLLIGEMYERRENSVKNLPTAAGYLLDMHTLRD